MLNTSLIGRNHLICDYNCPIQSCHYFKCSNVFTLACLIGSANPLCLHHWANICNDREVFYSKTHIITVEGKFYTKYKTRIRLSMLGNPYLWYRFAHIDHTCSSFCLNRLQFLYMVNISLVNTKPGSHNIAMMSSPVLALSSCFLQNFRQSK